MQLPVAHKSSNNVSVIFFLNIAELQAILLTTQHIAQNSLQCGVVCTDSLSAIRPLSPTRQPHHPIVSVIRETASSQQLWTLSHHRIPGNELANSVDKEPQNCSLHCWNHLQIVISLTALENVSPKTGIHTGKTCQKLVNTNVSNQCRVLGATYTNL